MSGYIMVGAYSHIKLGWIPYVKDAIVLNSITYVHKECLTIGAASPWTACETGTLNSKQNLNSELSREVWRE